LNKAHDLPSIPVDTVSIRTRYRKNIKITGIIFKSLIIRLVLSFGIVLIVSKGKDVPMLN
jgi:hypothetical protein